MKYAQNNSQIITLKLNSHIDTIYSRMSTQVYILLHLLKLVLIYLFNVKTHWARANSIVINGTAQLRMLVVLYSDIGTEPFSLKKGPRIELTL